jgi:HK97 gp10 family phage protein
MHSDQFDSKVQGMLKDLTDLAERWVRREAPHKTGQLKAATRQDGGGDSRHVYVSKSVAPYFEYVIDGTRPHDIVPKNKQALAWPGMIGGPYKKVKHPGTKANPYVDKAFNHMLPEVDKIVERFHYWLVNI